MSAVVSPKHMFFTAYIEIKNICFVERRTLKNAVKYSKTQI
jgi:hypothetical protein